MKRYISHLFVAAFTFALSFLGTALFFYQPAQKEKTGEPAAPVGNKIETVQKQSNEQPERPTEPKSLSPYDIQSFISDNPQADTENLWRKLNISGEFNGLPNWEKNENLLETCRYCEAEIFKYNLDDEPGAEIILRVSDNSAEESRYLIFKSVDPQNDKWRLLGFIDHDFGRYRMPEHSFLLSGGKAFLVVQVQTQSGSGVSHYVDRLFTVQKGKLIELLSYPAEGRQSLNSHYPDREFSGRVSDCRIENETARIEVEYAVNYSSWDEKTKSAFLLWSKKQKAVYVKRSNSKQAKLDVSKSNITQKEIDTIYQVDASSYADTLKYNLAELNAIAREKGRRGKWARRFLATE